jgi:hypothetical protein
MVLPVLAVERTGVHLENLPSQLKRWSVAIISAITGACLGLVFRLAATSRIFGDSDNSAFWLVTIGFLAAVPMAMGYLSVDLYWRGTPRSVIRWYKWLFLPWVAVLIEIAFVALVKWEGAICVIFASPIMLVASLIGGLAARLVWWRLGKQTQGTLSAVALPLLVLLIEAHIASPWQIRSVETTILIHAPSETVWNNIKSVHAIEKNELPDSWIQHIGFPRPIAATLSHNGVGGVREASFTGGLVFTETVNQWDPEHDLRFSIRANTNSIPPTTLDEHVTVGGAFFDVLDGEYRIEPRSDGVLLHLTSHERLSTHLNPYAGIWTDAVMRTIQRQILVIIRNRCQADTLKP